MTTGWNTPASQSVTINNNQTTTTSGTYTQSIQPEINIKQGTEDIADGSGSYDFGEVNQNSSKATVFTIGNNGNDILCLTGDPIIQIIGANASDFLITQEPQTSIDSDVSITFEITFSPASIGVKEAEVIIPNSDLDENPYNFTISGTVHVLPLINSIDPTQGFIGTQITIEGVHFGATQGLGYITFFNGVVASEILSWSDTEIICTIPVGALTGCVTVTTNNGTSECYSFEVEVPASDISILPCPVNFGETQVDSTGNAAVSISNSGTGDLIITDIQVSGADVDQFNLHDILSFPITIQPESQYAVNLDFSPNSVGSKTATICIASNDPDENFLCCNLEGEGVVTPVSIDSIWPLSGVPGATEVTLVGSNFGAEQGTGYVTFYNGIVASNVIAWSDAQIVCTVPEGTESGCVTVTTDQGTSNCVAFTINQGAEVPVFTPYSGNPLVSGHLIAPHRVFKHGDEYRCYYQKRISDGSYPADFHLDLMTSNDGLVWNLAQENVLSDQQSGHTFNYYATELKEGDTYRVWHSATSDWNIAGMNLYYSTSQNGLDFMGEGVVFENGTFPEYDSRGIKHPMVVHDGEMYHLYYKAYIGQDTGSADPSYHSTIAYATSPDGLAWTKHGVVIEIGGEGAFDSNSVSFPVVVYDGNRFEMFYNAYDGSISSPGYAVSEDGLNWEKIGPVGSVEGVIIGAVKENGNYRIWYQYSPEQYLYELCYAEGRVGSAEENYNLQWENQEISGYAVRDFAASVVYGGKLYMIGGRDDLPGGGYSATGRLVESYDPQTNTLESLATYPRTEGRYGSVAAFVDGIIYVFGGTNVMGSYNTNTVDMYSISEDTWSLGVAQLPKVTSETGAVVVDGKIYIMGMHAYGSGGAIDPTVLKFDPQDNSFTEVSTMPTARLGFVSCAVNGLIYVIGGRDTQLNLVNVVEVYDPARNQWETLTAIPICAQHMVGGVYSYRIYCGTGMGDTGLTLNDVYEYNIAADRWKKINPLETSRLAAMGGIIGDQFVIIGGSGESGRLNGPYLEIGTFYLDTDDDGLSDDIENANPCLDPNDADTDDDGIIDGDEDADHDGVLGIDDNETHPCFADTDGDGIQDGTELGYTAGHPTDTDSNIFQPDLDTGETTKPLIGDSDGDGVLDGDEDLNHNGRVDSGETDPDDMYFYPVSAGDVNADGSVGLEDSIVALKVLTGMNPDQTVNKAADIDRDGRIGLVEVVYALQVAADLREENPLYSNATLYGPWLIEVPEEARVFIIGDGMGSLTGHAMFNEADPPGSYQVQPDGAYTLTTNFEDIAVTFLGTLTSPTEGTLRVDTMIGTITKVVDISICQGTWSGTLTESGTSNTYEITFTVDQNGQITSLTGFAGPIAGQMFSQTGRAIAFFTTGRTDPYNQIKITGNISGNSLSGAYEINNGDDEDGIVTLIRN